MYAGRCDGNEYAHKHVRIVYVCMYILQIPLRSKFDTNNDSLSLWDTIHNTLKCTVTALLLVTLQHYTTQMHGGHLYIHTIQCAQIPHCSIVYTGVSVL